MQGDYLSLNTVNTKDEEIKILADAFFAPEDAEKALNSPPSTKENSEKNEEKAFEYAREAYYGLKNQG